ncbi:hypothetical protein B5K03_11635 [Rhizobium phaseoli]|uniref:hypothetical protein n=1 Tax=Rhizobium phaseoli TaxID=396 RepID=UPI000D68195A|nr:hypothetical protein [Rhizobium phaseoli]PWI54092.1 hypothetical protein B5K03_11635 [Rhizobium phaseoli]
MSNDALTDDKLNRAQQWYEDAIEIRGCQLSLPQIKSAYRELQKLTGTEAERIISLLTKPNDSSDEDWGKERAFLKDNAFRLTVSVIGFDGETAYGETEDIFDSKDFPFPIRVIFFTNTTAFSRNAGGSEPRNRFSIWVSFDKPPLFDPNPLVSEQTPNNSKIEIHAEDVSYFRAIQNIITTKILSNRKWYGLIHAKFAYDIGLWLIAFPYSLYWITIYCDYFVPTTGPHASFRVAFYIYGLGVSLFTYRALFGYLKWAFPVNVLDENEDHAMRHRVILGGIVTSLIVTGAKSLLSNLFGI